LKVYRPGEIILEEIEKVSNSFKFSHGAIRATALISSSPTSYQFEVINVGEGALTELLFSYNREIFSIEPRGNFFIEPNESAQFNLTIKNVTSTRIKDAIVAYSGDNSDYILIDINFTKEESEVEADYIEGGDAESSVYYCSELFGKICSGGEVCSGETASSIDGACCLEQCVKEKSESKAWIGYLIVGVIILILLIVYVKYKKTKPTPAQKEKGGF
ncbi:MAG: hypothetical protein HY361_00675, partial [Candidatus Aenigmarchaeota archaeon]|nr:hypothetical protein [Candidatus Aenigmarchaeota archaeon]